MAVQKGGDSTSSTRPETQHERCSLGCQQRGERATMKEDPQRTPSPKGMSAETSSCNREGSIQLKDANSRLNSSILHRPPLCGGGWPWPQHVLQSERLQGTGYKAAGMTHPTTQGTGPKAPGSYLLRGPVRLVRFPAPLQR